MILTLSNGMILTGTVDEIIEYINKTITVDIQKDDTKYNKSFYVDYPHHDTKTYDNIK